MALPGSGPLSIQAVATEFGGSVPHAMNEYYRNGAYVGSGAPNVPTSGAISLYQFYNASKGGFTFSPIISSNTLNYNLKSAAIAAGWNQTDPLYATVTVNGGVYVGSTSTGAYAFDTGVTFPSGSTFVLYNNGYILGCSGAGGAGINYSNVGGAVGSGGGPALRAQVAITIYNYGTIGGGGGGGGGGGTAYSVNSKGKSTSYSYASGGGGAGGAGWYAGGGGAGGYASGWAAGSAGGTGTTTAGGTGGNGGTMTDPGYTTATGGKGGNGGGWGSSGATGATGTSSPVGANYAGRAGGAGGYCTSGNANITWAVAGTRLGTLG